MGEDDIHSDAIPYQVELYTVISDSSYKRIAMSKGPWEVRNVKMLRRIINFLCFPA